MTVYFIEDGDAVKIGYTKDKNPEKRLRALQTANPRKLRLLGFIPGGVEVESRIHSELAHHRLEGEWFELCRPVLDHVALLVGNHNIKQTKKSRKKPKGFASVDLQKVLTKKQQREILNSKPSLLSFIDTPDGTMMIPTLALRDAIKNNTPLQSIVIQCKDPVGLEQDYSGVQMWVKIIESPEEFWAIPREQQEEAVGLIVADVYPQIRHDILDILQDPKFDNSEPVIPVVRLIHADKQNGVCHLSVTAYPCRKYLTEQNQQLARGIAEFGTFPLAIQCGQDSNGHEKMLFTPISDDAMDSLGWH